MNTTTMNEKAKYPSAEEPSMRFLESSLTKYFVMLLETARGNMTSRKSLRMKVRQIAFVIV